MAEYNYSTFDIKTEMDPFGNFQNMLHVGGRAPDFPLEDLASGETVQMKDLWAKGPVVIEFGSFT